MSDISIHALMKRATYALCSCRPATSYFNPRPHEEGDTARNVCNCKYRDFNPRPHEEGDVKPPVTKTISSDFNPRPHEEGDTY